MTNPRQRVKNTIGQIQPFDDLESKHQADATTWLDSGVPIFRISKPDNPPKHLVSYFVLYDQTNQSLMLIDHIKAGLWLPAGGHVEIDEDPRHTVVREADEELKIRADFATPFGNKPFFITVTQTRNADIHTDVSLWYVIKGDANAKLEFDTGEMNGYKWLSFDQILSTDEGEFDPHMHRFTQKMMQGSFGQAR